MNITAVMLPFAVGAVALCAVAGNAGPRVSYTPLSEAARKSGQLDLYRDAPMAGGQVRLGDYTLSYELPRKARAYDVIPIRYRLTQPAGARLAAVEAVAFEDPAKAGNQALYDLAIPGKMAMDIEYLGSVSAEYTPETYISMTPDAKAPVSPYPPFKREDLLLSSTIKPAPLIWLKVRLTNTGDTILDPEGFGASFLAPILRKLDAEGKEEWYAQPINLFERQLEYLYPGDSVEEWVHFWCPQFGGEFNHGLKEGDYKLEFRMVYRYNRDYNWGINIWGGAEYALLSMPFKVRAEGGETPIEPTLHASSATYETMPGLFDRFEEFMTSFVIHEGAEAATEQEGTFYLQVAPWTKHIALKLILTDPKELALVRVPIEVSDETLDVTYNPDNVMVVEQDGLEQPAFVAQAMPGMRTGLQLGPYPEDHLKAEMAEMADLGVNVFANTSGGWWLGELTGREGVEPLSAQYKYFYDTVARQQPGVKLMGWSVYPPAGIGWYDNAEPLLGFKPQPVLNEDGAVDLADPVAAQVVAAWAKFNYTRWGDMWFRTRDGRVPVDMEDSWGWMRDDINVRDVAGPLTLAKFREWLQAKYGTLEALNTAWGTSFESFEVINPQENQGVEGDGMTHGPVYNLDDHPFHEWNTATEDWDVFRTELRMDFIEATNTLLGEAIPGAELELRTEGANLVLDGDGKSDSMHLRHVYYSQRRNAMVNSVVKARDTLHFYSDYTTLPYTAAEWRDAMREMVSNGVIPVLLPQFDHMRDILINPHYGREYQRHYNLSEPSKGMMVHCLMAAYPWWKATYEEGGAPGIIWSDYLCDGFATETQKRELALLTEHFHKMER